MNSVRNRQGPGKDQVNLKKEHDTEYKFCILELIISRKKIIAITLNCKNTFYALWVKSFASIYS